ncbi:MAG: excinuclease ABC subunit A [Verrucomicrobia bacterium]|nr:excinuclease ABC subunit A [Verrucomicrobiota bacterium]
MKPGARAEAIRIEGARVHNLRNLTLEIPRNRLVVMTGVSGSGKSTLAFDLLFAEGQRRFLDSMNTYARQFVEQLARPEVDRVAGLPPTVSIEQRHSRGGGKSTVATVTEVYHFLRLLFARLGTVYCPQCQQPVGSQTRDQLGRRLREELRQRGDLLLLAPVVRARKGFHTDVGRWAAQHGYAEVRADGRLHPADRPLRLDRYREHNVEVVVGTLRRGPTARGGGAAAQRLVDDALEVGQGTLLARDRRGRETIHSRARACPGCGQSFGELDPKQFSYHSPRGWCPRCRGFGEIFDLPDVDRGGRADAIEESWFGWQEGHRELCPECRGGRLNALARAVRLEKVRAGGRASRWTVEQWGSMSVREAAREAGRARFPGESARVGRDLMRQIQERLQFLETVGLDYLELGRAVTSLSSGEAQRIRLAAQLGSNLSGVLYILDEPTIGLHPRDNNRLLDALEALRGRGNSLIVVEHDEETMRRADYIVDLGPGAGLGGGEVVAAGTLRDLMRHPKSVTGRCLREQRDYPSRGRRRPVEEGAGSDPVSWITLSGARRYNLKNLTARFPGNRLILVTGVSGSGKSTLVRECLLPCVRSGLDRRGARRPAPPADLGQVSGAEGITAVHEVDQSPIGRTPRSIPATYVGFFDEIRRLFSQTPEARLRGYGPSRFSFNSASGRCAPCEGAGLIKMEMSFLPAAFVPCEHCQGTRFDRETLDVEFHGLNIARVLELSVGEAIEVFAAVPRVRQPLEVLRDTGLDYLKLGQTSPTLSGGEAQRIKLVAHLLSGLRPGGRGGRPAAGPALFLLEEPTIGLHQADVARLIDMLHRLVDAGHTVVVIEHHPDLIAEADWVIDLGPEGGAGGGEIVAAGPPERVARNKRSHTGRLLRKLLRIA